jgi:hypothetical protein
MLTATAMGGNCELAVLAPKTDPLMPEAASAGTVSWLRDRRTVRPVESRPTLFLLGALLTSEGLRVTLARPYTLEIVVETSVDGSPGSWAPIGTMPAGETVRLFTVPESAGSAVRARPADEQHGVATSPVVFAAQPSRCGHRQAADDRPRLRQVYTEEEIFTDEELAGRFRLDMTRLIDQLAQQRPRTSPATRTQPAASTVVGDRWEAYLEECERIVGRPLTSKLFGRLVMGMSASPARPSWGVDVTATIEEDADEAEPEEKTDETASDPIPDWARTGWRNWMARAVENAAHRDKTKRPPLLVRILVARLFAQLLGHGVWAPNDDSWRRSLARLTQVLTPTDPDDAPEQSFQHVAALTAVCMGLLRSGASLTGGTPEDILAAQTWSRVREVIARTDAGLADDLLIRPVRPYAHVLSKPELEDLIALANADPATQIEEELLTAGWELERRGEIYRVTGSFRNPIPVAARVATLLADYVETVVVHATAHGNGAFIAWRRPDLVLASAPQGNAWRVYRVTGPATPDSRLAGGGEGITRTGLVGSPVPLRRATPETARRLLTDVGIDPIAVVRVLTNPDSDW